MGGGIAFVGLEVYQDGCTTLEPAYGERIGPPTLLSDQVKRGRLGLKLGRGFYGFGNGQGAEVARCRDRAYADLTQLRDSLGSITLVESRYR